MLPQDPAVPEDEISQQVWRRLQLRFPDQTLTLQTKLQADLQIDSLAWLDVTLDIGRHCGIELPDDALVRMQTVGDLLKLARQAGQFDPEHATLQSSINLPEDVLGAERHYWLSPLSGLELAAGWCLYAFNWVLMRMLFRLRVQGLGNLPQGSQFVIAPHHISYLDALVLGAVLPFRLMKHSYWAAFTGVAFGPIFRILRRLTHIVPVDMARGAASSLAYGAAVLKKGHNLIWFPEGQISRSGEVLPLRPGLGLLLTRYPASVVLVNIEGTRTALPFGHRVPRPGAVTITFGRPLLSRELERIGDGTDLADKITVALQREMTRFCVMKATPVSRSRVAPLLWVLMGLFGLRVLGQVLVEFWQVSFLPPSEEWFSGLLSYPPLLASQILILLLMVKIGLDFTRQTGWSYQPRYRAGFWLLAFGSVYLVTMIIRYAVRMSLYPHERWTGGSIPIFFHWVLAAYVLALGYDHYQRRIRPRNDGQPSMLRRWSAIAGRWCGGVVVVAAIALWVFYMLLPSLLAQQLGMRRSEYAVRIERSVKFTTADGIELAADIYRPRRAPGKTPTVLVRLPYSKTTSNMLFATIVGQMWSERGYTVVIQGTRGRYDSGGSYDPLRYERQDGIETLQWLAQQPWYDGRVGMWGGSYFGYTQWAIADRQNPGPTALLIQEASTDFQEMFHPGGAFSLESALRWAIMSRGKQDIVPHDDELARGFSGFPLIEADDRAVGDIPFFNAWVQHEHDDEYWTQIDGDDRAARLQAPVLLMAGWYDPFLPTQLADFQRIKSHANPRVASESCLIIGPWIHAQTVSFPDGTSPRNYRLESLAPSLTWFDRHLLGRPGSALPPVRIYTMGIHRWRDEQEWPLARTKYTPYFLRSAGNANSVQGDGQLMPEGADGAESPDRFTFNPRDPVPSAGGTMLGTRAGIAQQSEVEARNDVLVYTTAPATEDLEITGPIKLVLHVSTTAPCTDFTAKLVDVHPNGDAYNISDGVLRQRFESQHKVTEISIELWPTSSVILRGHCVRLEVSSSNYPRFDRNPNTGSEIASELSCVVARQTVFHTKDHPSRLILPLIPK